MLWPMPAAILAVYCFLSLSGSVAVAQQGKEIRVSATIPPRLCRFPDRCARVGQTATTMLVVDGDIIRYIGSPPLVATANEVMTILF